jgi:CBS domain-containing protein
MLVKDLMRTNIESCRPDASLESVALKMWNHDCGVIPVVDNENRPIGMITDRDIAMGCSLNHRALWDMQAADVLNHRPVYSCDSEDNLDTLLQMMKDHQVRRIPVTDTNGQLSGIVAIGDAVNTAKKNGGRSNKSIGYDKVMDVLKSVSNPEHFDHELIKAG